MSNGTTPPGFPSGIPIVQENFENWAQGIEVDNLWTCTPNNVNDVVTVCNWAASQGWTVRPRGIMHGWSPLTVTEGQSPANVLLVDTTVNLTKVTVTPANGSQAPQVTVETGTTMLALMTAMENAPGGTGSAPGYSFAHIPAPGNITVGGALAINAHGSAFPVPPNDSFAIPYGSLSNLILSFTAVVTDPASPNPKQYVARTFQRGDADAKAFLTHCGRAFLLEVTLQAIPNYNLQCQSYMNIDADTLFAPPATPGGPPPPKSVGDFLNQSGRIEVIWFPPLPLLPGLPVSSPTYPWFKVWTVAPAQPAGSVAVTGPNNYPFSDSIDVKISNLLKQILGGAPWLTPSMTAIMAAVTSSGLNNASAPLTNLWGPSKNTLIYVGDNTLRVTANGYAVLMKRADVQQAIADFTVEYVRLLLQFQNMKNGWLPAPLYPINSPCEIRVTALDDPSALVLPPGQTASSPVISSLSIDPVVSAAGWDVAVWFDVLTTLSPSDPDSQSAWDFYAQMEQWVRSHFAGYRAMPEWSKGWAYTGASGPWTDPTYISEFQQTMTTGRNADDTWAWEVSTLAKYDAANLYTNPFLTTLFK